VFRVVSHDILQEITLGKTIVKVKLLPCARFRILTAMKILLFRVRIEEAKSFETLV